MITVELLSFIKKELSSGKSKEQIKSELLAGGGWSIVDVEEAFKTIETPSPAQYAPIIYTSTFSISTLLKILGGGMLGFLSSFFYNGNIFLLLKIEPKGALNAIVQILSLTSFGFATILVLILFFRKKIHVNIWKVLIIVLGSGVAFYFAILTAMSFTLGVLEKDPLILVSFGIAGIVGGFLMLLSLRVAVRFSILTFIILTLVSGIIGGVFGSGTGGGLLVASWQAIMLACVTYVAHCSVSKNKIIDSTLSVVTPNNNLNYKNYKKSLKTLGIVVVVIMVLFFGSRILSKSLLKDTILSSFFVQSVNSNKIISNTRSISAVSENPSELLKILKMDDKRISGDSDPSKAITKTQDGRFWFFEVRDVGCSEFCVSDGYMIDSQKKTISNLNVREVVFHIVPMGGSFVTIEDYVSYDKNKKLIYDASKDKVVDEIEDSNETSNFKLLSDNTYSYIRSNFLYVRNVLKHEDIKLGRMYRYYSYYGSFEPIFNISKGVFYVLIHENEQPSNPEHELPTNPDPVRLVEWNIQNNTNRYVSEKSFDFPLTFELIQEGTILLGGGLNRSDSLETDSTYLVDINTGETKEIFKDKSLLVEVDKVKKQINIYQLGENNFISGNSGGPHESGMVSVFDYSGKFISKTYFKNYFSYQVLEGGTGNFATLGDTVKVRYSIPGYSKELELKLEPESNASTLEFSSLGMKTGEKRHIVFSADLTTRSNLIYTIPEQRSAEFELEVISINN